MERIASLKEKAFNIGENPDKEKESNYLFRKAVLEFPSVYAHNIKRAKIDCLIFDNYSIEIDPQELIVGRFSQGFKHTPEQEKIDKKGADIIKYTWELCGAFPGETGHRVIDYEKLLNHGIKSVLEHIDKKLMQINYSNPDASEKYAFYYSCKLSLEGICRFAKRFHEKLMEFYSNEKDEKRKAEYLVMAENFSRAPYEPCSNFYEALQCMWFVQFSMKLVGDISLTGRIDNYLYPFYKKDIESGALTSDSAFELIENLYLKHNEIYGTWPAAIMVGGVDRQGNPVWNELSYMCVEAIETTGLINPSVSVCYNEHMPDDLLYKCVDIISKGYTKPSIFNDRLIQEGLMDAGVTLEDSRYYIHSTCVEITPIGSSNILVATPYINLNKSIEYVLNDKKAIFGDDCNVYEPIEFKLKDLETFEEFYNLVKEVVSSIIKKHLIEVCHHSYKREHYMSSPLASPFLNDCLEREKDSAAGGARYNFIYPCFPGFINLVDTLAAVKHAVYDEGVISLEELAHLCRTNYKDNERLRQYLINRCPKFGNDINEVDKIGVEMYELIRAELKKYKNNLNGSFHPSYFAWIMHGVLGNAASASPDGRLQGEALSECLSSVQGMDKNGPTAVMRSIAKIEQKSGIGGIATNYRFSKNMITSSEGKKSVVDFIKVFMENDCFEIQFNVVDQKVLLDAQKNPSNHSTLMVRVAGYSDYFVNLDVKIQNEIIKRSEHGEI